MQIQALLKQYLEIYPQETDSLRLLSEQLKQHDSITSRKNFVGHVTASGFVINTHTKRVLLLEHKTLMKLLQPGGHVDSEDVSLIETTLREIEEETGIKHRDLALHPVFPRHIEVPFDVNTHFIPENKIKNEPGHYHHDFRYLFTTENSNVEINLKESNNYKWIDWEDFAEISSFSHIADKIDVILEPNAREFFRALTNEISKGISVVAVSHIIPSSEDYILSLHENFNLIGIIPKPKSINETTRKRLVQAGVPILDQFSRENISENPYGLIELLRVNDKVCLIDIGGYFSETIDQIKKQLGSKLIGIVEDTENGHQKYEKKLSGKYSIVSVARSSLKEFEDQLVGQSVAHATETVLRQINTVSTSNFLQHLVFSPRR